MELLQVATDTHKHMVRDLAIEYLALVEQKWKELYDVKLYPNRIPDRVDDWLQSKFDAYIAPNGYFFLALVDGQPVGIGGLRRENETTSQIKRVYVKPSFRGRKIGKAITNKLLDVSKSDGYKTVILDTFDFWDVAPKLYQSIGFVHTEPNLNTEIPQAMLKHIIFMKLELE